MNRHRWLGILTLGIRRSTLGLVSGGGRRLRMTVAGVALAIGFLIVVSSIALGLAGPGQVAASGTDYWIVPESSGSTSLTVSVGSARLGESHEVTEQLREDPRIRQATPVLIHILRVPTSNDSIEYVLGVGVVPDQDHRRVLGVSTRGLIPGDPHFDNGSYNGSFTGEMVLNSAGSEILDTNPGDRITARSTTGEQQMTVERVDDSEYATRIGPVPIAVVHLAELQRLANETATDSADQVLVEASDPAVRTRLEGIYPHTAVVSEQDRGGIDPSISSLPTAMAGTAALTALAVGILFVMTMIGLQVNADRKSLATMAAIGMGRRHQTALVVIETITLCLVGGIVGVGLGSGLAIGLPHVIALIGIGSLETVIAWWFLPAGLAIAIGIGIFGAMLPVVKLQRFDPLAVIRS